MKKYLTRKNIMIALAVLLLAYLLWPSAKKPAENTTVVPGGVVTPITPPASVRPENTFDRNSGITKSSVPIGPSMQTRQAPARPANAPLVSIDLKEKSSSIIPLN